MAVTCVTLGCILLSSSQAQTRRAVTPCSQDLTGIRCLYTTYDNFAGAPGLLISDIAARGAVVDVLSHTTNPYPLLDDSYDILWMQAIGEVPSGADLAMLLDWVKSGDKSIFFVGVTYWLSDTVDLLSDSLDLGIETETVQLQSGVTTNIAPHAITVNIDSLENITNWYLDIFDISPPAGLLASTAGNVPMAAFSTSGDIRIVVIGASLFWSNRINLANNRLLGNQAFDWLALTDQVVGVPHDGTSSRSVRQISLPLLMSYAAMEAPLFRSACTITRLS